MMSAAQKLFESACQTYWKFLINCPYDLDYSDYVENDFKWQFYRIKNPDVHSMADVERDFNKVFSSRYSNDLSANYRESNGSVYALNGERGAHLYYSASKIRYHSLLRIIMTAVISAKNHIPKLIHFRWCLKTASGRSANSLCLTKHLRSITWKNRRYYTW